ncbi:MAG: mevalonate kinase [Alphaproteobacteria bacterium]|nr:mevalonate kinase [Alphaproteobacteria bacterium]
MTGPRVVTGRAPGKLIVLGEHAVVYGHRAVAAAVSRHTVVELTAADGPTSLVEAPVDDARLRQAIALALPATGWVVRVRSNLPIGRGMGSSASLSIALLRAAAAARGERLSTQDLHDQGFPLERVFHGNPSGVDHAVAAMGGAVVFRRGEPPRPLRFPPTSLVVLDSGTAGDTGAMVAAVAARRPAIDPLLDRLGALVEQSLPTLGDPQALGAAMNEAHALLRQIGVSTDALDDLVDLARSCGSPGAKLAGAGGGGVVMALTPGGSEPLLREARHRGIHAFECVLPEA